MSRFEIFIEDAKEIFASKGCELLSESCAHEGVVLDYICACGRNARSSIRNLKKRKTPCVLCKVPNIEKIRKIFEDKGCVLISTECNAITEPLEYICKCKRHIKDSLHKFQMREKPCIKCDLPPVEDVKKIFLDLGATPLFETFDGMKQKLKYKCVCGDENETLYERVVKGMLCKKCGDKKKSYTYEYVKKYFEDNDCVLISTEYKGCTSELLYMCSCGNREPNKTIFQRFIKGHRCRRCANMKADFEKAEKMMNEKNCKLLTTYDTYYDGNLEYTCHCNKQKVISYRQFMAKYDNWTGCTDCNILSQRKPYDDVFDLFEDKGLILLTTEYTNRHQKLLCICSCENIAHLTVAEVMRGRLCDNCADDRRKETNIERYGCENPFQSEDIKLKIKKTMLERYGCEHNMQIPGMIEKVKNTNIEKYGEIYASKTEETKTKMKDTNLEKYGCENPMQNVNIFKKAMNSCFRKKQYIAPNGRVFDVQGYEPYSLDYIIKEYEIDENDIITECLEMPEIYYFDPEKRVTRRYYPDIYIPKHNVIIEVKSKYTYNLHEQTNIAKFKRVMELGYTMELQIFNKKGEMIDAKMDAWDE